MTAPSAQQVQPRQTSAGSQRLIETLERLHALDASLAAKLQPAGQLALFQQTVGPSVAREHTWRYVGHQKAGVLYECVHCPATMRTTRRFENALTTYSLDGRRYKKTRPACAPSSAKKAS